MDNPLSIKPLSKADIDFVTEISRKEGFAPGVGDLGIYQNTDSQGLWVGWLNDTPIGCIAGVRYNENYGFLGLFLVIEKFRGRGFGLQLWKKAMAHLSDLPCVGLEAAPERIADYSKWGFTVSSKTTRWQWLGNGKFLDECLTQEDLNNFSFVEDSSIPSTAVEKFDEKREATPRPHFLSNWLNHPAGKVIAVIDKEGICHGFGRIRPCLLKTGDGWRIGPLMADSPKLLKILLKKLIDSHPGLIIIDTPGLNNSATELFKDLGFKSESETFRMYRGYQPPVSMNDVYGLACLELG
ncbi:GNAT family N-acetyltransferase [Prochlorococcus marinus]|uniref:GNAT family N-acetyltransferase n=1 Tax=Prochlorococcus marinus XMU1408 TaxID=2213228 RepID=A0A318R243_PROMR|nr:GNAT family N-acetyltransferase [Prochlorococcus marinus]MBW3041804.1 GNAT family N-acetyltransferase [Prochlorococcus marinus str. XMU1408]PYE02945.1 GNAT family N-acetyltransferase [Prochlorococcus marinus XMU1408]